MPSHRPPITWPNGARICVNVSVSFETWPDDVGRPGSIQREKRRPFPPDAIFKQNLHTLFERRFGEKIGIQRVIDFFDRYDIKSTFFFNGVTVERFPELARQLRDAGHELSSETYVHDYSYMKTVEQDRADIARSVKAFQDVLGQPPLGYLSTGHMPTNDTPRIAAGLGYKYWVDPSDEELPYTLKVDGKELTAIPYTYAISDYSTVGDDEWSMRQVGEAWTDTFDWLYEQGAESPTRLPIVLHPWVAGRPYRMKVLEDFIKHVRSHPDVWICRLIDVVDWWQAHHKDSYVEEWPNYYKGV